MDHEVDISVEVNGKRWDFIGGFYDRETGEFSYEDIRGICTSFLPPELLLEIGDAGQRAADIEEAERRMDEADYHLEAAYEERCGGEE